MGPEICRPPRDGVSSFQRREYRWQLARIDKRGLGLSCRIKQTNILAHNMDKSLNNIDKESISNTFCSELLNYSLPLQPFSSLGRPMHYALWSIVPVQILTLGQWGHSLGINWELRLGICNSGLSDFRQNLKDFANIVKYVTTNHKYPRIGWWDFIFVFSLSKSSLDNLIQ